MSRLTVYADATALIGLARIDRLQLLSLLPLPINVTAEVWREVVGVPGKPGVAALTGARDEGLLVVVEEGDPTAYPGLDAGESSVLSAAAAKGAAVIIDERKARALVQTDDHLRGALQGSLGIVGLILLAKRGELIPAIRPVLDDLIRQGFWIQTDLYREALRQVGEM